MTPAGNAIVKGLLAATTALLVVASGSKVAVAVPNEPAYTLHNVHEMWAKGYKGEGVTIAIIDHGVNLSHEYFIGQVVDGVCVYIPQNSNLCPNGTKFQTGVQAASQRFENGVLVARENHGNMVAGLAVGKPNDLAPGGIAPNAKLVMANVDLMIPSVVTALNYIYENREKYNIVAVSMSLIINSPSFREYLSDCNQNPEYAQFKQALAKLRGAGIIPFAAAGNTKSNEGITAAPTCLSEAVSVGSIDSRGQLASYMTVSPKLELLGSAFAKSASTSGYRISSGTSAATPVVAASYALLRQAFPSLSSEVVLEKMKSSGRMIDDVTRKQIPVVDLTAAFNALSMIAEPQPPLTSYPEVSPQPATTPKISATSSKGNFVLNIRGYEGKKFVAKIGNGWVKIDPLVSSPGLGYTKIVRKAASKSSVRYQVFIDGKAIVSGSVLIR